jgi:hypothetical protein
MAGRRAPLGVITTRLVSAVWSRRGLLVEGVRWGAGGAVPGRTSFTQLRRIFDRNRSMVVGVSAATARGSATRSGLVVGARGEVLTFGRAPTGSRLRVARADGQSIAAIVLGRVGDLPLVLARAEGDLGEARVARPSPRFPRAHGRVLRIAWLPAGPEASLGSVYAPPDVRGLAEVDVPGELGAALFDGAGRWIGVGLDQRRRRSRFAAAARLIEPMQAMVRA